VEHLSALRVVVGYRCNYQCRFCYQRERGGGFLRAHELASILNARPRLRPRFVTLMGGEPTLCGELAQMIAGLRHRFPDAELSVTSNGSAETATYLELDRLGVDNLTFSIPTLDEAAYPGLSGQAVQGLEEYLRKVEEVRARARAAVRVNAYAHAGNALDFYRLCKRLGLKLTLCEDLVSADRARAQALALPGVPLVFADALRKVYRDADGYEVWHYLHVQEFAYANLIVLPDGSVTEDFADVLAQRGARA